MKTFEISWTETHNKCQTVEAQSLEDAYAIAERMYSNRMYSSRDVILREDDFVSVEIMAVDPETGETIKDEIE